MQKLIAVLAVAFTVFAAQARDPYDVHPFQISIFPPIQIFEEEVHITGLKLNLLYGYNTAVSGFDFGVLSGAGDFEGIQLNLANYVQEEARGLRLSLINLSDDTEGIEIAPINYASVGAEGLRIGVVNVAAESKGLQIGLVNYTRHMRGIQIGLINVIAESKVSFLPILNARF